MPASPSSPVEVFPITAAAKRAASAIQEMLRALPIDDRLTDKEAKAAQISSRISVEAVNLVVRVLDDEPASFPNLEARTLREGLAYIAAMDTVAAALRTALDRVEKSGAKRRKAMTDATLSVYSILKSLMRVGVGTRQTSRLKELQKLLTTRTAARATKVTRAELQVEAKKLKATKKARREAEKAAVLTKEAADAAARARGG